MSARTSLAAGGLAIVLALAACGDGGGGVSETAAGPLAERVAAVRVAAGQDREQALLQLIALRQEVARFRDEGALTAAAAARILTAADEVEGGLDEVAAAEPTTTTAPPTTAPAEEDDDEDRGRGKGKGGEDDD